MSGQNWNSPAKTSNLPDKCPMTGANLQACPNETLGRTIFENEDCLWQVCQESNFTVFAAPLKH